MNAKFSIGIVIAIVLQVSGFVWWIAQQSQTIDTLKGEVAELTAKSQIEKEVTLANDVKQLRKDLDELNQKTLDAVLELQQVRASEINRVGEHTDTRVDELGTYFDNKISNLVTDLQKILTQHEEWINELDLDVDTVYSYIDDEIQKLDKKLSDRMKESK